jgi:hypothetical protein
VETGSVALNAGQEQPDFQIEHSQQHDEGPADVAIADGLVAADVEAPAAETPQWPSAEPAAPAGDASDDDQLNAFFKGLN